MHDIPFHRHQRRRANAKRITLSHLFWRIPLEEVIENPHLSKRKDKVICSCSVCSGRKWKNEIPISARKKLLREKDVD
jgi:hypothetical protein